MSIEPEITSTFFDEFDTIETKVLEALLHEVIDLEFSKSKNLLHEVIEPEVPNPPSYITLGPSPSLPLSQTEPPSIYLGSNDESIPYGLVSIEEIRKEDPRPSTPVHWSGLHFYSTQPLPPFQNPTQTPLPNSFDSHISHDNIHWDC